ncbi:hypothetical protein [Streptomonospora wellingtoniae]|uniref:Uncharacterized protein n=1 Tax=Streptomonospora wellingtoniae TaxID=3075544 RepID=A0ABU2KT67_9ACTN|nr:hypothetical protein [Streptomonospora sp. DSM 45055]MDT0302433.1 hypothetical protein [Streptomonospora sp. DSM 45055]
MAMRLVFSNADEETLDRDLLPRAAASWAAGQPVPPVSRRALRAVTGYKLGEPGCGGDGLVARWTAADVWTLLRHWVPAREALPAAEARAVPGALRTWWAFLDRNGWLDPRSAHLANLEQAVEDAARMTGAPRRVGHPTEDTRGLGFAAFAAAARGDADGALPPRPPGGWGRLGCSLPPAELPAAEELAEAVAAAPVCADARTGCGDPAAGELLEHWWSGFTAVRGAAADRLRRAGAADGADRDAADALIGAVLTALSLGRERGAPTPLVPRMAAGLAADLAAAVRSRGPTAAMRRPTGSFRDSTPEAAGPAGAAAAAEPLLAELEHLGAVAHGVSDAGGVGGTTAARHTSTVPTPLGRWLWFALLAWHGVRPLTCGELMAEDAEVLIDRASSGDPFTERELREWITARGPARALPELVEVYRRSDDCVHRSLANRMTSAYALQARSCYERLRSDPDFGGRARCWLFDAGFAKLESLEPHDHLGPLLDGLAASLRTGTYGHEDGAGGNGAFPGVGGPELPTVFDTAAASGHPEARFVLRWFARHHPDPRVRAAAGTSLARTDRAPARGPGGPHG